MFWDLILPARKTFRFSVGDDCRVGHTCHGLREQSSARQNISRGVLKIGGVASCGAVQNKSALESNRGRKSPAKCAVSGAWFSGKMYSSIAGA